MLEPTVPRGDTECTLGCTSVVPVPLIAPTGLFMKEDVLVCLLCKMLSTVFSMKTRLFFIPSAFVGEFVNVFPFVATAESFRLRCYKLKDPESPWPTPLVMPENCGA